MQEEFNNLYYTSPSNLKKTVEFEFASNGGKLRSSLARLQNAPLFRAPLWNLKTHHPIAHHLRHIL